MRGRVCAEAPRQVRERLVGRETHDVGYARMVTHERGHRSFRNENQLRTGMAPGEGPDERRGQQDVADGAEADQEDAQHAGNVSLALPAFASRV